MICVTRRWNASNRNDRNELLFPFFFYLFAFLFPCPIGRQRRYKCYVCVPCRVKWTTFVHILWACEAFSRRLEQCVFVQLKCAHCCTSTTALNVRIHVYFRFIFTKMQFYEFFFALTSAMVMTVARHVGTWEGFHYNTKSYF